MRFVQLLVGLSILPSSAALAQLAPAVAPAVQQKSTAVAEKKICRREEGVGSRLNRKICLTREQWADKARAEADDRGGNRDPSAFDGDPR